MILSPFEWTIAKRYLLPGKGEAFIALVASISIGVVMLSVAMLIVVMSVMNGFRAELLDKITGLNGHAIVQAYGGRMDDWENILEEVRATPGVVDASPLIEQPLLGSFNGRVEAILIRGNIQEDLDALATKAISGDFAQLQPGASKVAIGVRLAENIGARVGDTITVINPQGRSTPFGTMPRQIGYEVAAIFEVGVYDYDGAFVVMPMQDAQTLMLIGDAVSMIEVTVNDPDQVGEILAPVQRAVQGRAVVNDWKTINSALFDALQVERAAMAFALSFMVLVAAFNILSSLVMLVRAKTRDIAIMRTMGATRQSLMKIFVTTGFTVGAIGDGDRACAGLRDPRRAAADRPGDRRADRAGLMGSAIPLPYHHSLEGRWRRGDHDRAARTGPQLPRHALPGVEGGEHRSRAGAAL